MGVVYRYLTANKLFLSKNYNATDIFLAEFIDSCRKGDSVPPSTDKYASIGAHLGLSNIWNYTAASFKDDLESLCYIMIDMFTEGTYFQAPQNVSSNKLPHWYLTKKHDINPSHLGLVPPVYIQFYIFVRSLSLNETPALDYWKKQFRQHFLME